MISVYDQKINMEYTITEFESCRRHKHKKQLQLGCNDGEGVKFLIYKKIDKMNWELYYQSTLQHFDSLDSFWKNAAPIHEERWYKTKLGQFHHISIDF